MQLIKNKPIAETPGYILSVFKRDIAFLKLKDVKRAYSKLTQDFMKGKITNEDAKTLAYLLSGYIQIIKDCEFEERLLKLEKKAGDK